MNNKDNNKYIPLSSAAKIAGITAGYLKILVHRGKLKAVKIGRNWFTTEKWLNNYQKSTGRLLYEEQRAEVVRNFRTAEMEKSLPTVFAVLTKRKLKIKTFERRIDLRPFIVVIAVFFVAVVSTGLISGLISRGNISDFGSQRIRTAAFSDIFLGFPKDFFRFRNWLTLLFNPVKETAENPIESAPSKLVKTGELIPQINNLEEAIALDTPTGGGKIAEEAATMPEIVSAAPEFSAIENRLSTVEGAIDEISLIKAELSLQRKDFFDLSSRINVLAKLVPTYPISTFVVQGQPATLTSYSVQPSINTGFDRLSGNYFTLANDATINGSLTVRSGGNFNSLSVSGSLSAGAGTLSSLNISGNTTLNNLTISGNFSGASSTLSFANASSTYLTISNTGWVNQLNVVGTATTTLNGPVSSASGDLIIAGNSANDLLLNPYGGNVGIGTTTPNNLLSLFKSTTPALGFTTGSGDSAWTMGIDTADANKFKIASSTAVGTNARLTIDGSGNVGIRTAGPGATLEVYQPSSGTAGILLSGNTPTAGDTASGNGMILTLGFSASGNRQLWLTDSAQYGNSSYNSFRYIVGFNVPIIDAVSNDGVTRKNLSFAYTDTNVGIGFPVTATQSTIAAKLHVLGTGTGTGLAFRVDDSGGNAKVVIRDNGNVGIGTTTPAALLDLYTTGANIAHFSRSSGTGWITLQEGGTIKTYLGQEGSSGGGLGTGTLANSTVLRSENALHLLTAGGGVRMTIDTAGNVGIGTTSPGQKLQVDGGNVYVPNGSVKAGDVAESSAARFMAAEAITEHAHYGFLDVSTINYATSGVFGHSAFNAANVINGTTNSDHHHSFQDSAEFAGSGTLTEYAGYFSAPTVSTGTVTTLRNFWAKTPTGLGTIGTYYGFYADGGTNASNNYAFYSAGGAASQFGGPLTIGGWMNLPNTYGVAIRNAANSAYRSAVALDGSNVLSIGIDTDIAAVRLGTTAEAIRITSTGNVGIGTTTPADKLDVAQSGASFGGIRIENNGAGGGAYSFYVTNSANPNGGNKLGFYDQTSGLYRMMIDSTGNVGIGTTTPQANLHVAGNVDIGDSFLDGSFSDSKQILTLSGNVPNQKVLFRVRQLDNTAGGTLTAGVHVEAPDGAGGYYNGSMHIYGSNYNVPAFRGNTIVTNDAGNGLLLRSINPVAASAVIRVFAGSTGGFADERVTILGTGNVGIGTTSPAKKLDVYDASVSRIRVDGPLATEPGYEWGSAATTKWLMYRPVSTGDLRIYDNAGVGDMVTFKTGGNVGIGTSTGLFARTTIAGSTSNSTASALSIINSASTSLFFVRNDGNVGIGTTTPSNKLDLQTGTLATGQFGLYIAGTNTNSAADEYSNYINMTGAGTGVGQRALRVDLQAGYSGSQSTFAVDAVNRSASTGNNPFSALGNIAMRGVAHSLNPTDGSGLEIGLSGSARWGTVNIGVFGFGTYTNGVLNRNGQTSIGVYGVAQNDADSSTQIGGFFSLYNGIQTYQSAGLLVDNGPAALPIIVARDNGSEVFRIADGGNVGIGTTTPASKLVVGGTIDVDGGVQSRLSLHTTQAGSKQWSLTNEGNSNRLRFMYADDTSDTNPVSAMVITGTSNVGIGTTTPFGKLSLVGIANDSGTNPLCWSSANGQVSFSTACTASDVRLKTNIVSLSGTSTLDKILQLNPVTFNWIDPSRGASTQIGLIAQEVEPIFPEVVFTDGSGFKGIMYDRLTSPLIKGVQELASTTVSLESRIKNLEYRINATSTLQASQGTIDLTTLNGDLNLNGFSIINVKSITGLNGLWRIDEGGNLIVQDIKTQTISSAKGLTTYDEDTGQPFCIKIKNGQIVSLPGYCQDVNISNLVPASAPLPAAAAPATTTPIAGSPTSGISEVGLPMGTEAIATSTPVLDATSVATSTLLISTISVSATTTATSTP